MTIPTILQEHLRAHRVHFDLLEHPPTLSSSQTAQTSHVSGNRLAKGVLTKDAKGFVLAVLPASHHIEWAALRSLTHRALELADESETAALFEDCEPGAVPPFGDAYGLQMVIDDSLHDLAEVYCESGDHRSLVRVPGGEFDAMMSRAPHGLFTRHD